MSYYKYLIEKRKDDLELIQIMNSVTNDLINHKTDENKPGTLLGLIQSGKTRAFLGVMANCFDQNYDIAIIFTKNSVALVEQTIRRLKSEFEMPIEHKKLYVWDVIKLQNTDQLTGYILQNKIIFVVKKEIKNLEKLHEIFKEKKSLRNKNTLIIDDEADQASVSFINDKSSDDGIDFAKISRSISDFRNLLSGQNSYLQVTATPYSLYLQPEDPSLNGYAYAPIRPAFTHLLKPHKAYIGGKYYFEDSQWEDNTSYYVHIQVSENELDYLNSKSKTKDAYNKKALDNCLRTSNFKILRNALINYLVAGSIRQIQEEKADDIWAKPYHSAFVLHTSVTKQIHRQQKNLVECIIKCLEELSVTEIYALVENAYNSFKHSLIIENHHIPTLDQIVVKLRTALDKGYIGVIEVNSENQVIELLGDDGQLRLDNPFNIFVGGQTLDRGITIDHLIGFFYGRSPKKFQMDTVLQHSRMYGARSPRDLAVTRFYTSATVYNAMRKMHFFDADLRQNIEKDIHAARTYFIAKDGNKIIPAGPNKLKASNLISFKGFSRLLPIGFQTRSYTDIEPIIKKIDLIISEHVDDIKGVGEVNSILAHQILDLIGDTFAYEPRFDNIGLEWDTLPVKKAIELALKHNNTDDIVLYVKKGRDISRYKYNNTAFTDAPDDGKTDIPEAKVLGRYKPVILLLKQKGRKEKGWRDSEFYWPIILMPQNMLNYVYCED